MNEMKVGIISDIHDNIPNLLKSFEEFEIFYISREENKEADKLANSFIENNLF